MPLLSVVTVNTISPALFLPSTTPEAFRLKITVSPVAVSTRPLSPPAVARVYFSTKEACPSAPASVVVFVKLFAKLVLASIVRSVSST